MSASHWRTREKTDTNFSGQEMEPCLDKKSHAFEETTEISHRVLLSLLKIKQIDVEFSDITLTVSTGISDTKKKEVLKSVSGSFSSGQLIAIMGPSGAGKSSLLRVLSGFTTKGVQGTIRYSGNGLHSKKEKKERCYIMQEDCLSPLFTVYEIMTHCGNLKLGPNFPEKAKQLLIEDIIDMMGLTKCRDTKCRSLSGGQRKRLSIALELVDNPPVMFLDEPTTGLDSVSSLQCAKVLKSLARGGRTIVCTIHQPCATVMALFDNVYILCNGQCMYQGASNNILPYLRQFGLECPRYHNPTDFMMEVVCGEYGSYQSLLIQAAKNDIWNLQKHVPAIESGEELKQSKPKQPSEKTVVPNDSPNEYQRFFILFKSYYTQLYRDWTVSHLKVLLHIFVGGLLGALFLDSGNNGSKTISNLGYLFCCVVYLSYTTMLPAVIRFPLERAIVTKEQFNNWYRLRTYYMALTLSSIPVQLFYCTIHISVSYFLSSQPLEWERFVMMLLMCFMCVLVAESFGIFFGTLFSPVTGTFCGALSIAYMILFGGFFILFTHMPKYLYWMSYLCFIRFSYEGIITAVYSYDRPKLTCPEDVIYCHLSNPEYILKEMGVSGNVYWVDFGVLLVMVVFMRCVGYCAMKKVMSSR
ncbi:ATP-binding cassette sub-family G member 1 isoform X2 [Cryptotermes secundus]|uniref:ATP-binding cassette sub-family G member 1 isoform X2 n=1 Tax=Cryptotermes secundus TaxID=105785 RepID=UPI000CD7BE82|nr:ATP-binding cassette sub-family G member 1 isoform X2 [Cryptotermes secundus]